VSDPDQLGKRLTAIRKAGARDLTVPAYAHLLVEVTLRAGVAAEQVRKATYETPYWSSE